MMNENLEILKKNAARERMKAELEPVVMETEEGSIAFHSIEEAEAYEGAAEVDPAAPAQTLEAIRQKKKRRRVAKAYRFYAHYLQTGNRPPLCWLEGLTEGNLKSGRRKAIEKYPAFAWHRGWAVCDGITDEELRHAMSVNEQEVSIG